MRRPSRKTASPPRSAIAESSPPPRAESGETGLARYILPSSGTMIGICTTLVGLVKFLESQSGPSHVDEYGSLIAVCFLSSAVLSYLAIRMASARPRVSRRCERVADVFFLVGLVSVVGIGVLFAFEAV
ncbi:hypothetical protein [Hansschlegelia sp. KR7-227]|uniref:hypothetical protein n=1 Tax=Hansschlegelia sp. KR7-227 TaxID=3400914 RepID=UPI003BFFE6D5